jgi:hypothetical protein
MVNESPPLNTKTPLSKSMPSTIRAELLLDTAPPVVMVKSLRICNAIVPVLLRESVLVAPGGAETVRLLMVNVSAKLDAVIESIVTLFDTSFVMKIPDWSIDGGSASDHKRDSSQNPFVGLM